METLTRNLKTGERTFYIYTKEEADAKGIKYVYWKDAEDGGWALSDDGYVAECYGVKEYTSKRLRSGDVRKKYIKLAFGVYWTNKYSKCLWLERKTIGDYSNVNPEGWQDKEARKERTRRLVKLYAHMFMMGKMDWDLLGQVYRKDQKNAAATARRLLKQERIQQMVSEEIQQLLTDHGITRAFIVDEMKASLQGAKQKGDYTNVNRVIEKFIAMLEMEPKNTSQKQLGPPPLDPEVMELMEAEDRRMRDSQNKLIGEEAQYEDIEDEKEEPVGNL